MNSIFSKISKQNGIILGGLALVVATAGTSLALQTRAATDTTTPTSSTTSSTQKQEIDATKGGHIGKNGGKEELLTGEIAAKITAAALAANPGGTIQRVETDADGATYEAHLSKADGTQITVLFDEDYNITGTETGRGPR